MVSERREQDATEDRQVPGGDRAAEEGDPYRDAQIVWDESRQCVTGTTQPIGSYYASVVRGYRSRAGASYRSGRSSGVPDDSEEVGTVAPALLCRRRVSVDGQERPRPVTDDERRHADDLRPMTDVTQALSLLATLSVGVLVGFVAYLSTRPEGLVLTAPAVWGLGLAVAAVVAVTVWTGRHAA